MTEKTLHLRKPDLNEIEELLLLRGANPMSFVAVWYDPETGYQGGLYVDPDGLPIKEIAKRFDRSETDRTESGFSPMIDGPPKNMVLAAILPENELTGYSAEQRGELSRMLLSRLPDRALPVLTRSVLTVDIDPIIWINHLSCGDREARLQALLSVPLQTDRLLLDPEFRERVDRRAPLTDLIAERSSLGPAETRRYARLEAQLSKILARVAEGREPLDREPDLKPLRYGAPTLRMRAYDLRRVAVRAAKRLRTDQVPDTPEETVDMLTYVRESDRIRDALRLSEGPFLRHLSRVPPATAGEGVWARAGKNLQSQVSEQETSDYLGALSRTMVTAILIDRVRDRLDMSRLAEAARLLREKAEPEEADALHLKGFVDGLNAERDRLRSVEYAMVRLIGERHGLKSLREAQVRWHHVQQTLEMGVMSPGSELSWSPLIGETDLGPVRAVELTSSADLERQGRRENHCVGGYTGTVMGATSERASLIFSLERDGEVLSTVEMGASISPWDRHRGDVSWRVLQNKAARNADPGPEATAAAEALRDHLAGLPKKRVRAYLSGIATNATRLRDGLAKLTTELGGDVVNRDLPEQALTTYAEVMPKTLRGLGPEALLDALSRGDLKFDPDVFAKLADRVVRSVPIPEAPDQASPLSLAS